MLRHACGFALANSSGTSQRTAHQRPRSTWVSTTSTATRRNTVNTSVKRTRRTEREVQKLIDAARKHGRYGHRDATMILIAYRHGLRALHQAGAGSLQGLLEAGHDTRALQAYLGHKNIQHTVL